jgi:uncharacterized protein
VTLADAIILLVASIAGGVVNSVAGGGSLITFPTLVWLGRDPIIANATNCFALWPGSIAAMVAFGGEVRKLRSWMMLLAVPSLVGGVAGAILLLWTPSEVFAAIVPWLILFATVLFAAQGPITAAMHRWRRRGGAAPVAADATTHPPSTDRWVSIAAYQLGVAIYGGYFGAGMGIMMLAGFGLLGFTDLHHGVVLRNFCAVLINLIAAIIFAASDAVYWPDAAVMIVGQIIGGYSGAALARRLGRGFIRRFVIVVGIAMAASLFFAR